jgi:hypothetical protein
MVIDYKKFKPKQPLAKSGLFYVLEQLPSVDTETLFAKVSPICSGLIVARDQSETLRKQGYWPSYNSAVYPEIFNASGMWAAVEQVGTVSPGIRVLCSMVTGSRTIKHHVHSSSNAISQMCAI